MRGGFARRRTVGRALDGRNYWFIVVVVIELRIEFFRVRFSVGIYRRSDNGVGGRFCELFRCVLSFDSQLLQALLGK
jgi:hypothetical protein